MLPTNTYNILNGLLGYSVLLTNFFHSIFARSVLFPNILNAIFGKPRTTIFNAIVTNSCSVFFYISHIIFGCAPPKVTNKIIGWFSVIMTRLHSLWARANKCLKNKAVNKFIVNYAISPQSNLKIPTPYSVHSKNPALTASKFPPSGKNPNIQTTYSSQIRHLVGGKITDRFPNFRHRLIYGMEIQNARSI